MTLNLENSQKYKEDVHKVIPGGCHTYSKGDDQWPELAPAAIKKGKGVYLWDLDDNKYLDCSMGLTSVSLGHAYQDVIDEVKKTLDDGINFQRPSNLELEAAKAFIDLVPGHDMIKFTKNGSTATTAAVKLARGFTGRKMVAFPKEHPFFSYDDWFIETTDCNKGTISSGNSLTYSCKDLSTLEDLFKKYPDQIACVITEPEKNFPMEENYLEKAIAITHKYNALFIQDEMVTGFKTGFPGSIVNNKLTPDLATWGKGIANGFSFCALTGTKEIMEQGGITVPGQEKLFLTSSTHGGETTALAAVIATIKCFKEKNVLVHNHNIGRLVIKKSKELINSKNLGQFIEVLGSHWIAAFKFMNKNREVDLSLRTLFMQEMIQNGVLFQGVFVPCFSHTEDDVNFFIASFEKALDVYAKALEGDVNEYLTGPSTKPVFRKFI